MQLLSSVCYDEHQATEYEKGYKQGYNNLSFNGLTMFSLYGYEDGIKDRLTIEKAMVLNNSMIWKGKGYGKQNRSY